MSVARRSSVRRSADAGMVVAETAVAIPAAVVLLGLLVWVIVLVSAQVQVVDAARAGARAAARGETLAASAAVAEEAAPDGADAIARRDGRDVQVSVTVLVRPPGGIAVLPAFTLHAVAYAADEQGVGASP